METVHNEPLTPLAAIPKTSIPVLMRANSTARDGRVHVLFQPLLTDSQNPGGGIFRGANVRLVPSSALRVFVKERQRTTFEQQYGPVGNQWRDKLLFLLRFTLAVRRGGTDLEETVQRGLAAGHVRPNALDDPITELGEQLNMGIKGIIFVVWWSYDKKRFAPGLYCPDARTALHALALSSIGEPGGLGACPRCDVSFIVSRVTKRYCSARCQQAASMMRSRNRRMQGQAETGGSNAK
jgi:hypothetical protein